MAPTAIFVGIFILFGSVNAGGWSEGQPGAPLAVPLNGTPQNNSTVVVSQIPPPNVDPQMFHISPMNMTGTPYTNANTPISTTDNAENQGPLGAVIRIITTFVRATPLSYFASSPDNAQVSIPNSAQNSTAVIPPVPTTTPAGPSPTGQPTPTATAGSPTVPTQLLAPVAMPAQPPTALSQTVGITPSPPVATSAPATISPAATNTTTPVPPPAPQPQPVPASSANVNFGLFNSGVLVTAFLVLGTVFLW
ncbi:putative microtubule-actin cross-linking factor 1 isoform X24 [Ditylenchus destructor]|uniref:Microtubule-actin cross-linking factor 1 isoform X24 n=1 Tax=Ditylenchus destructor TaxID=166010 RepID=A0AAD4RA87_9BILA|nr:putative microtubule-actin cross-linking factor 1 isoform X24 [Ditylenchus destructor]